MLKSVLYVKKLKIDHKMEAIKSVTWTNSRYKILCDTI